MFALSRRPYGRGARRLPDDRPSRDLLRSLRMITLAWGFGAAWMYITTGGALTRFAKHLGLPEFGFGLLAAVPFVGSLLQIPASYFIERYGHRKFIFVTAGLLNRLLWLAIALIPWVVPKAWWWTSLVGLIALSAFASHAANPGVMACFADIVPRPVRGRYFSRRAQVGQATGLLVTVLVGCALDRAALLDSVALQRTLSIILGSASLLGAADFLILAFLNDRELTPPNRSLRLSTMLAEPLRNRSFRHFLGYNATLMFGLGYVGQYIWLYVFDVVGLTNTQASLLLVAIPLLIAMVSLPVWGRAIDRYGRRPVLIIAGVLIAGGAAAWVAVTGAGWLLGYSIAALAMFAFPGVDLASFSMLLGHTSSKRSTSGGSAYVAVNSLVIAIAGTASGLFGGLVAQVLRDWHGSLFGWPLTYHGVLFLLSGMLRLAALGWLVGIEDRGACSVGQALAHIRLGAVTRIRNAVAAPVRGIGRLAGVSIHPR